MSTINAQGQNPNEDDEDQPRFEKARHIKYWLRCLKTLLPHQYTSNDSNRMYLGYFILSALDLLDVLHTHTTSEERSGYISWIYQCQHSNGGFRMYLGTEFGNRANEANTVWDPAHVPGSYFALASLLILGDDLRRVRRKETLKWIKQMQRPDGSFGETFVNGSIEGGRDPRFGFCVAGIRHILRGGDAIDDGPLQTEGELIEDVDIDAFVRCVQAAESYDGGIADEAFHEPHAGYTFCSLGAMQLFHRLNSTSLNADHQKLCAPIDPEAVTRWLALRQTDMIDPNDEMEIEPPCPTIDRVDESSEPFDHDDKLHQTAEETLMDPLELHTTYDEARPSCAGMNGRPMKPADTCYAFWVTASLNILHPPESGQVPVIDNDLLKRYLLVETQHTVLGGFGKFPADIPDLYHSYMGLAALTLISDDEEAKECTTGTTRALKALDASMCISKDATARMAEIWKRWSE